MGGVKGDCARELYVLSLGTLEKLYKARSDKLESLGLDEKGIPFIEPENNIEIIIRTQSSGIFKIISDVAARLGFFRDWLPD